MSNNVYIIDSDSNLGYIKLGRFNGTYIGLLNRYRTYYINPEITMFSCKNSRETEAKMLLHFRPYQIQGELFKKEILQDVIEFLNEITYDNCIHHDLNIRIEKNIKKRLKKPKPKKLTKEQEHEKYKEDFLNSLNNNEQEDAIEYIFNNIVEKEKSSEFCSDVYKSFTEWCESESRFKLKRIEFFDLVEKYFPKINKRKRIMINYKRENVWDGIKINS